MMPLDAWVEWDDADQLTRQVMAVFSSGYNAPLTQQAWLKFRELRRLMESHECSHPVAFLSARKYTTRDTLGVSTGGGVMVVCKLCERFLGSRDH